MLKQTSMLVLTHQQRRLLSLTAPMLPRMTTSRTRKRVEGTSRLQLARFCTISTHTALVLLLHQCLPTCTVTSHRRTPSFTVTRQSRRLCNGHPRRSSISPGRYFGHASERIRSTDQSTLLRVDQNSFQRNTCSGSLTARNPLRLVFLEWTLIMHLSHRGHHVGQACRH